MKEDYNPYCNLCQSCGHEGCCDFLQCFSKLVELNPECNNGQQYLKDARFSYRISAIAQDFLEKIKEQDEDLNELLRIYDQEWQRIHDITYNIKQHIDGKDKSLAGK